MRDPLQEAVEHDEVVPLGGEGLHRVVRGRAVCFGPAGPDRAVAVGDHRLRQRLEQGVEVEGFALLGDEAVEVGGEALVAVLVEQPPEPAEGAPLEAADRGIVDEIARAHRVGHLQCVAELLGAGRAIDRDIDRVEVAPVRRPERAAALRRGEEEARGAG